MIRSPHLSRVCAVQDPDAAVYYLAKMLYAGEDVKFIARQYHDLCGGRRRKRGPDGACRGSIGGAGGGADRDAGIPDRSCPRQCFMLRERRRVIRQSTRSLRRMKV